MSTQSLGHIAYCAFRDYRMERGYGDSCEWDVLKPESKAAFEAAARAVIVAHENSGPKKKSPGQLLYERNCRYIPAGCAAIPWESLPKSQKDNYEAMAKRNEGNRRRVSALEKLNQ